MVENVENDGFNLVMAWGSFKRENNGVLWLEKVCFSWSEKVDENCTI